MGHPVDFCVSFVGLVGHDISPTLKIVMRGRGGGAGVVDGVGSNNEKCLKWGGGVTKRSPLKLLKKRIR